MQSGKCVERGSMVEAVMWVPDGRAPSESRKVESGVEKFFERCVRIGLRRSSSSRRGRARLVSCVGGVR